MLKLFMFVNKKIISPQMDHVITGSDSNWTLFVFGCMFTLIAFRVIYYTYGLIRFSPELLFNHRRHDLLKVFVITPELFDLVNLCSNWLLLWKRYICCWWWLELGVEVWFPVWWMTEQLLTPLTLVPDICDSWPTQSKDYFHSTDSLR